MGVLNTTPRTWVSGETVTALEMNTEIRDAITTMEAAWSSWTPAWTAATTNPAIGNGTIVGRWNRVGKTVDYTVVVTAGSTTTFGTGSMQFSLPTAAVGGVNTPFMATMVIGGPGGRLLRIGYLSSSTLTIFADLAGVNVANTTAAFGSGTVFAIQGRYEAA